MLETEIKKLTEAVHALTAVMKPQEAASANTTPEVVTPAATTAAPVQAATAAPSPTPTTAQAPAAVEQAAPAAQAGAVTLDAAKSQLAAIIQKMNDGGAAVTALIAQMPSTTGAQPRLLSEVHPSAYQQLIDAAQEKANA